MAKSRVKVDVAKWEAIQKRIAEIDNMHVKVGVLAEAGGDATNAEGLTMIELAAIHEFGVTITLGARTRLSDRRSLGATTIVIPERSFIRRTFTDQEAKFAKFLTKLSRQYLANKIELKDALGLLGLLAVSEIKKTITEKRVTPDITQETKDRKGSSTPLVDTGQLINSIHHVVSTR